MGNIHSTDLPKELRLRQTEAEKILWYKIRDRQLGGVKFRRQQRIGSYIVDFVCLENKLIIEIDGGQHNETPTKESDERRTQWFKVRGYQVLRFWNNDVLGNMEGILENVNMVLKQRIHPHLTSPFRENLQGEPIKGEEELGGRGVF